MIILDTKTRIKYNAEYYTRVPLDVRRDDLQTLEDAAKRAGETRTAYIKRAIDERMTRDGVIDSPLLSARTPRNSRPQA